MMPIVYCQLCEDVARESRLCDDHFALYLDWKRDEGTLHEFVRGHEADDCTACAGRKCDECGCLESEHCHRTYAPLSGPQARCTVTGRWCA